MTSEAYIRIGSFIAMLIIMGSAESIWPRRVLTASKAQRWFSNISISILSTIAARLIIPIVPAAFALWCTQNGYGLLNTITIPQLIAIPLCVLTLDMVIYWQHFLFHHHRLLWRIHRMHHADINIDASTGIRFHPIEIILSVIIKLVAILVIGPPAIAVIIFEVVLNGCALFNHANVRLPLAFDARLRLLIVTPDMHRVHHSTNMREANMNFGFNFPWWDRLFGTYKEQPDLGHDNMQIGLNIFRAPNYGSLLKMLRMPFL